MVPTHRRPATLSALLESLRRLTYPATRLELIVVGGANDPGREAVKTFGASSDFPVVYCAIPDYQASSASFKRNEGARLARGNILAFTDDDCLVHPDWLTSAEPLFNGADVGAVEGGVEIPKPPKPTVTYRGSLRLARPGGYQTCNMFYRTSVFLACGGFDLSFPYYLEDTDLAYTVMERGYTIPFAAAATVSHPVQAGRPLKLLTIAGSVEQMPYLFRKHARSEARLRESIRPLNRSHYCYLSLYGAAALLTLANPRAAATALGLGLCIIVPLHLAHDLWGLHFTPIELALMAVCQPIVPILRLFYWLKGFTKQGLGLRRQGVRTGH